MAESASLDLTDRKLADARLVPRDAAIPWFAWTGVISVSSIAFGLYWDISWHMTIGRDTFWTPAHLLIQFGGILAAITCMWLVFSTTFGNNPAARASSVRIWGFRGPLGAFLTAWGGVTMLTSAPFDNWWHNSFGLDVQILSPPHVVLGLGMMGVGIGCLLLLVAEMNRAEAAARRKLMWLFLYLCGLLVFLHLILVSEFSDPTEMHSAIFYRVLSLGLPVLLIAFARASGYRWGATAVAGIYTLFMLSWEWILPLFPAQPKLGPVYTNVTHMVPIQFPLLILAPALAIDFVLNHFANRGKWFRSLLLGGGFLAALVAAHWPFADFMISRYARNWVFGMNYFPYQMPPSLYYQAYRFQHSEASRSVFWLGMGIALISAIVASRVGLAFGDWLSRIRR